MSFTFASPIPGTGVERLINGVYVPWGDSPSFIGTYIDWTSNPSDPFASFGFRFTAGGATTLTLRLRNGGTDNIGAILDDVSIQVIPGGVIPEPATWAMLIAGFGLVGMDARRRGRAAA